LLVAIVATNDDMSAILSCNSTMTARYAGGACSRENRSALDGSQPSGTGYLSAGIVFVFTNRFILFLLVEDFSVVLTVFVAVYLPWCVALACHQ
jgi:hypothetical protein